MKYFEPTKKWRKKNEKFKKKPQKILPILYQCEHKKGNNEKIVKKNCEWNEAKWKIILDKMKFNRVLAASYWKGNPSSFDIVQFFFCLSHSKKRKKKYWNIPVIVMCYRINTECKSIIVLAWFLQYLFIQLRM